MGFPIRKSADQSLFAAPHGLSQRTTSFIASQRQGIHRTPLRHLIALIIDAHRSAAAHHPEQGQWIRSIERPFASNISENLRSSTAHAGRSLQAKDKPKRSNMFPLHDDRQHALRRQDPLPQADQAAPTRNFSIRTNKPISRRRLKRSTVWWSQTGSNRRPHACKARALPTELWPRDSARTRSRQIQTGGPGKT